MHVNRSRIFTRKGKCQSSSSHVLEQFLVGLVEEKHIGKNTVKGHCFLIIRDLPSTDLLADSQ